MNRWVAWAIALPLLLTECGNTEKYLRRPYVKGISLSELSKLDLKWTYIDNNDQTRK